MRYLHVVAAQLNVKLARRLVQAITKSVNYHVTNTDIVVWGCKALSQTASHGKHLQVT